MSWIDYKKASDRIQKIWKIECLKEYKVSDKIIRFISEATEEMKDEIDSGKTNSNRG